MLQVQHDDQGRLCHLTGNVDEQVDAYYMPQKVAAEDKLLLRAQINHGWGSLNHAAPTSTFRFGERASHILEIASSLPYLLTNQVRVARLPAVTLVWSFLID
jgi:hypothetical protein